jgi:hypothetical protein
MIKINRLLPNDFQSYTAQAKRKELVEAGARRNAPHPPPLSQT